MALLTGQPNHLAARRGIAVAMVIGLLLFPATCAHATGPHSLFIDPRAASEPSSQRHAYGHAPASGHGSPARQHAAAIPGAGHAWPAGAPVMESLPDVMLMVIAATTMVAVLPDAVIMPDTPAPPLPGIEPKPAASAPTVEVPPPRSTAA
jgi:hypothetical protein